MEPGPAGERRTIAAGSYNIVGNFFGHVFNIKTAGGEPAFTGCVGWGFERWVLALFTQHGFEAKRWPSPLRQAVFG